MSEEMPLLLTPNEAARELRVSKSLVYRLAAEKRLPSVHVAGALRFPYAALQSWIESQLRSDQVGLEVLSG